MDYPTTIQATEDSITQSHNSGIVNPLGILLLTKHLKVLMAYCERRKKLSDKYNKAKTSYYRRQFGESISQLEGMLTDYLKIMNDKTEEQIYWAGLGGCE